MGLEQLYVLFQLFGTFTDDNSIEQYEAALMSSNWHWRESLTINAPHGIKSKSLSVTIRWHIRIV